MQIYLPSLVVMLHAIGLQASCLQEEETTSRVDHLQNLEKTHKHELQRLRNENENLQNRYVVLSMRLLCIHR